MSCAAFLEPHREWAEKDRKNRVVKFKLVSNQKDGLCSYTSGALRYKPGTTSADPIGIALPAALEGEGTQLFSNRPDEDNPFSHDDVDPLGVRLTLPDSDSDPPHLILTLHRWGDAHMNFVMECRNEVLIGSLSGTTFVMSLKNDTDLSGAGEP